MTLPPGFARFARRLALLAFTLLLLDLLVPYATLRTLRHSGIGLTYSVPSSDIIVLGASHMSFAFDDSAWHDESVRLTHCSRDGQFSEFFWSYYDRYRRGNPPPQLVVLDTPFFMFQKSHYESLLALQSSFDVDQGYLESLRMPTSRFYEYGEAFQLLPSILFRAASRSARTLNCGYAAELYPDFSQSDLTTRGLPRDRGERIGYRRDGWSMASNVIPARFFSRLLARLDREGVAVLLVETPEFEPTVKSVIDKDAFYQDLRAEIAPYPRTHLFLQGTAHSIDASNPRLFYDGGWGEINSHLSLAGSKLYTAELIARMRQLTVGAAAVR